MSIFSSVKLFTIPFHSKRKSSPISNDRTNRLRLCIP